MLCGSARALAGEEAREAYQAAVRRRGGAARFLLPSSHFRRAMAAYATHYCRAYAKARYAPRFRDGGVFLRRRALHRYSVAAYERYVARRVQRVGARRRGARRREARCAAARVLPCAAFDGMPVSQAMFCGVKGASACRVRHAAGNSLPSACRGGDICRRLL